MGHIRRSALGSHSLKSFIFALPSRVTYYPPKYYPDITHDKSSVCTQKRWVLGRQQWRWFCKLLEAMRWQCCQASREAILGLLMKLALYLWPWCKYQRFSLRLCYLNVCAFVYNNTCVYVFFILVSKHWERFHYFYSTYHTCHEANFFFLGVHSVQTIICNLRAGLLQLFVEYRVENPYFSTILRQKCGFAYFCRH